VNHVLLDSIGRSFDLEELRTLCFELGITCDALGGEGRVGKARELLLWAERHGRLPELLAALRRARPAVDWPAAESLTAPVAPPAPPPGYTITINGNVVDSNMAIGPNATLYAAPPPDRDEHPPDRAA